MSWIEDLKRTRKEFKNVDNLIAIFKFKYNRENRLIEWLTGVAVAILVSLSLTNIADNPPKLVQTIGIWGYITSLLLIGIIFIISIATSGRQKKAIAYLYKEKDKLK